MIFLCLYHADGARKGVEIFCGSSGVNFRLVLCFECSRDSHRKGAAIGCQQTEYDVS
jgi:hypothetical protein